MPLNYTETLFQNQPQGLFILISDHDNSLLTAISAASMLCKMLDYQKNSHAEIVLKELGNQEPAFLAIFGLEDLLDAEPC